MNLSDTYVLKQHKKLLGIIRKTNEQKKNVPFNWSSQATMGTHFWITEMWYISTSKDSGMPEEGGHDVML